MSAGVTTSRRALSMAGRTVAFSSWQRPATQALFGSQSGGPLHIRARVAQDAENASALTPTIAIGQRTAGSLACRAR